MYLFVENKAQRDIDMRYLEEKIGCDGEVDVTNNVV